MASAGLTRLAPGHLRRGLRELAALGGTVPPSTLGHYLLAIGTSLGGILRSSSLAAADAGMTGRTIRLSFDGQQYDLTGVPFSLVRELYCKQVYFPDPNWQPQAEDLVLDLGANIGAFSLLCARRGCRVIAIEMNRDFETPMRDLLRRNDCAAMVSLVHGVVAPSPSSRADGPALLGADLQALSRGQTIALAKVDIEGSEFGLVLDDSDWLASVQRLTMEVHVDFGDPAALRGRLRALGFEAWLADKSGARVDRVVEPVGFCYAFR